MIQRTKEDRERYCKSPIWKTDLSKPTSQCIEELRNKISNARGQLYDIMSGKGWEDRLEHVEGLLTCGLIALYSAMEEIYKAELKREDHIHGPSLSFGSRGIGLDVTGGCFVCGQFYRHEGANEYMHNIAAHVDKEDEQAVLDLFDRGVRMGYYHGDEQSPQIKIGACDLHLPNLQYLHDRTHYYRRIRLADVTAALEFIHNEKETKI